jgi:hypothetical protein
VPDYAVRLSLEDFAVLELDADGFSAIETRRINSNGFSGE